MFGRSDAEIRRVVTTLQSRLGKIGSYAWAYAGWLMSNLEFRSEQRHLLQEFRNKIVSEGFPTRRMLNCKSQSENPAFFERCRSHYERWILDGVEGPDLPVPVSPQFPNPMPSETSPGVLSHVIPAYFPVSGQGWFSDMLDDSRPTIRQMPHLKEWFENVRKENASLNKMSVYRRRLKLLHFWRGLYCSFPNQLHNSKRRLTGVFAEYLHAGEDTIKDDLRALRSVLSEEWITPP